MESYERVGGAAQVNCISENSLAINRPSGGREELGSPDSGGKECWGSRVPLLKGEAKTPGGGESGEVLWPHSETTSSLDPESWPWTATYSHGKPVRRTELKPPGFAGQ